MHQILKPIAQGPPLNSRTVGAGALQCQAPGTQEVLWSSASVPLQTAPPEFESRPGRRGQSPHSTVTCKRRHRRRIDLEDKAKVVA